MPLTTAESTCGYNTFRELGYSSNSAREFMMISSNMLRNAGCHTLAECRLQSYNHQLYPLRRENVRQDQLALKEEPVMNKS